MIFLSRKNIQIKKTYRNKKYCYTFSSGQTRHRYELPIVYSVPVLELGLLTKKKKKVFFGHCTQFSRPIQTVNIVGNAANLKDGCQRFTSRWQHKRKLPFFFGRKLFSRTQNYFTNSFINSGRVRATKHCQMCLHSHKPIAS